MMILIGPVFKRELQQTARQKKYFLVRTLYGSLLLAVMCWIGLGPDAFRRGSEYVTPNEFVAMARYLFQTLVWTQMLAVLALTPALVAGSIADEYQRKTMHDLLTSQLSGPEIVIDKLFARLLSVGIFIFLSLPILAIMTLLGGIDPREVAFTYGLTLSTTLLVGSMSLWVSTGSRTVRDAVARAYAILAIWLFAPVFIEMICSALYLQKSGTQIDQIRETLIEFLASFHPLYLLSEISDLDNLREFLACFSVHIGISLILIAWTALTLRASYAKISGDKRPKWAGKQRARNVVTCSDEPVFWKERYFTRYRGLSRLLLGFVWLSMVGGMCFVIHLQFQSLFDNDQNGFFQPPQQLNATIRAFTSILIMIMMCAVGARSAGSITSEREGDSWISLTATPLDRREILNGKTRAAILAQRNTFIVIACFWIIGLVTFVIDPLSVLITCLSCAAYIEFASQLGIYFSLRSGTSWKAQSQTLAILLGLCMLPMCCIPLNDSIALVIWCSPVFSVAATQNRWDDWFRILSNQPNGSTLIAIISFPLWLFAYAIAGWTLRENAREAFTIAAGRPVRPSQVPSGLENGQRSAAKAQH